MVKKVLIIVFCSYVFASASTYETNCLACHTKLPVSIDKYFYRYLLKYSSKTQVQKAMSEYLIKPHKDQTIMPEAFISRFGIKRPTKLSNKELNEALDEYWNIYKVFGKLK